MQISHPVRVEHSHTQHLQAPPEAVFPLLCPVREIDWVNGWEPNTIFTQSGLNESDCVFWIEDKGVESIWTTTVWDPNNNRVEFLKVTPGLIESMQTLGSNRGVIVIPEGDPYPLSPTVTATGLRPFLETLS